MNANQDAETRREWLRIDEPVTGVTSSKQEAAIREYAHAEGYKDLRGYHAHLRSIGWDYYDVLRAVYWEE